MPTARDTQRQVRATAYRQAGYITARQALELGLTYQAQKYHADHGNWVRVARGIYRLRDWPSTVEDAYVLWSLWSGGRGVLSHATALAVHDLGVLDPGHVHLTVPPGFRAQHPVVVTTAAVLPATDVEQREAYRVTTPLRTLLDVAAAADTTQEAVTDVVADALDRGVVTAGRLRRRIDEAGERAALRVERALGAVAR
ncbi:type IV toxin-antitoxin system AbiEi family antitoxin domain-containing protein [Kineococcus sp. LSe6-4]|uniref:Type IV toxin-antitoxin system AbiEi family antitoxin domain-containing protein n=1 Tax=Kineococcus halophytocola TaxID=3234027 RepID=A0ABV4H4V8_9ACTN